MLITHWNSWQLFGTTSKCAHVLLQVMIWDDHQVKCIGELSFRSQVRAAPVTSCSWSPARATAAPAAAASAVAVATAAVAAVAVLDSATACEQRPRSWISRRDREDANTAVELAAPLVHQHTACACQRHIDTAPAGLYSLRHVGVLEHASLARRSTMQQPPLGDAAAHSHGSTCCTS